MAQYDLAAEILAFHDQHVRLSDADVKVLKDKRDLNLDYIRFGLDDLERPRFKDWRNQGGFAMKTVVNDPAQESNHDLDAALIFDADDLPAGPLQARQRVQDALCKRARNFSDEPEARTNAVTVWYSDGYHLDFAVYRRSKDALGNYSYEHASTQWVARDPDEVTTWFNKAVDDKSPKADTFGTPKVRVGQLRRIVRLTKWFCRSRASWNLPGGMIVSTLVVECYRADRDRDDVALYNTLTAVKARLDGNRRVFHPKADGRELTGKAQYLNQVELLKEKLAEKLPKLAEVVASGCTRDDARKAWNAIFKHSFWGDAEVLEEAAVVAKADTGVGGHSISMACQLFKQNGKPAGFYRTGQVLPKNMGLEFSVTSTTVALPYDVQFEVQNTGDEARQAHEIAWSRKASGYDPRWRTTAAYKGHHLMTCSIVKEGLTLASTSIVIKIGAGLWKGVRG